MSWTQERVDLLYRLADEGLSAQMIADRFGEGCTRNSIAGKAHRLGIKLKGCEAAEVHPNKIERSPELRARLEKMCQAGFSQKEMAAEIGTCRETVAAMLDEFGLQSQPHLRVRQRARAAKREPAKPVISKPVISSATEVLPLPIERLLPLADLREANCRWPYGHPGAPDFGFCGVRATHGPYCPYHTRIACRAAPIRKRKPAQAPRRFEARSFDCYEASL
jgi:GcrA cell cycle regulator